MKKMPQLRPIAIKLQKATLWAKIKYWKSYIRQWEVVEDWFYTLPNKTKIMIPKGFIFDGASVPKQLWSWLSPTGVLLLPSLVHDFCYQYDYLLTFGETGYIKYQEHAGQKYWDKLFRELAIIESDLPTVSKGSWLALKLFGSIAWKKNRKL